MNIWEFNRRLTERLLLINIVNVTIGERLARRDGYWGGIGVQAIGWGLINIAIALFGRSSTRRRFDQLEDPLDNEILSNERRRLRRILMMNTPLNVLYMWGGHQMSMMERAEQDDFFRGNGRGIIIQGAILFAFDLIHTILISKRW